MLRKRCPYSEFFWSSYSRIWSKYLYSVQMRENTEQKNSEHGHFLLSGMNKDSEK